jgi:proteasome accessory factor B
VANHDGPSRSERVLNLLAFLLDRRRPVPRHEILAEIPGYPGGDTEAARRAFERDKEMLRSMGVPVKVIVGADSSDTAYTVDPDEYYLPELGLSDDETAALRVAVSAVALGTGAGEGAMLKLGGFAGDTTAPIAALPIVPQLASLFDAFRRRCVVTFRYRGEQRTVEPWALTSRRGRWYLVGHDRDRKARRTFRADRVGEDVKLGPPDAFDVPPDFRVEDAVREQAWNFGDDVVTVDLAVDADRTEGLVDALGPDVERQPMPDGRVLLQIGVANPGALLPLLLDHGERVEVIGPESLRHDVIEWVRAIVETAS